MAGEEAHGENMERLSNGTLDRQSWSLTTAGI